MTHHRDARGILDGAHQLVAAARDDQVDQVVEGEQGLDFGARLGQVQGIGQRRILAQRRIDGGEQRGIGAARLRAALEDGGVARFQAQGGDLHQRVRARLEYDAQHPDRHRDPGQHEVVVEAPPPLDLADRIGQLVQLPHPLHYARELLLQAQPLDQRRRHTGAAGVFQVRPVGGQDRLAPRLQVGGDALQGGVLGRGRGGGQPPAGGARRLGHLTYRHAGPNILTRGRRRGTFFMLPIHGCARLPRQRCARSRPVPRPPPTRGARRRWCRPAS